MWGWVDAIIRLLEKRPSMTEGNDVRLPGEAVGGELDEGRPLLAEEEAAEAPFHEGEPAQPDDYVQEDVDETPEEAAGG